MLIEQWERTGGFGLDVRITLSKDDLIEMEKGGSVYSEYHTGQEKTGVEVVVGDDLPRLSPLNKPKPREDEIFDDSLDAVMMFTLAFKELERMIEDNESYPDKHTRDYSGIVRQIKNKYDVEEAMNTYTYYSQMLRDMK